MLTKLTIFRIGVRLIDIILKFDAMPQSMCGFLESQENIKLKVSSQKLFVQYCKIVIIGKAAFWVVFTLSSCIELNLSS